MTLVRPFPYPAGVGVGASRFRVPEAAGAGVRPVLMPRFEREGGAYDLAGVMPEPL